MRISFIGLGNMGKPLAANILKTGQTLKIFTSKKETEKYFKDLGADIAHSLQEAADCDVICTCVPRPADLISLMMGSKGLYSLLKTGSIHLDFSTIDPQTADELEKAAEEKNIGYVQATVNKTPQIAEKGESPFFVGGKPEAVNSIYPLLEKIGKPEKVDSVKAACFIKILSNQMGMAALSIVCEGLTLANLAGVDMKSALKLLETTGAASFQMLTRGPWIVNDDYDARFAVDLALKDLSLGATMAKSLGFEPPIISQTLKYMKDAQEAGLGEEDMCAIFKIIDKGN